MEMIITGMRINNYYGKKSIISNAKILHSQEVLTICELESMILKQKTEIIMNRMIVNDKHKKSKSKHIAI